MNVPRSPVVGRLAPSPTGGLHVGHARTFFLAWLLARGAGGRIILRIEDIDSGRVRPEAIDAILDDLKRLGLDWDEGPDIGGPHAPYLQSGRTPLYAAALDRLKRAEGVYPCTCTRADIARAASAPHAEDEGPTYPGTCARRTVADAERLAAAGRAFAWRFRVPDGPIAWNDLVAGDRAINLRRQGGDFVIGRSTGEPSYQLAVVVDDAAMGVTQVIRGADLIPSTPRQLALYEALGHDAPEFGHVGLVLDHEDKRLAKRDASLKLATLFERGISAASLRDVLARSFGLDGAPGDRAAGIRPEWAQPWRLPAEIG